MNITPPAKPLRDLLKAAIIAIKANWKPMREIILLEKVINHFVVQYHLVKFRNAQTDLIIQRSWLI